MCMHLTTYWAIDSMKNGKRSAKLRFSQSKWSTKSSNKRRGIIPEESHPSVYLSVISYNASQWSLMFLSKMFCRPWKVNRQWVFFSTSLPITTASEIALSEKHLHFRQLNGSYLIKLYIWWSLSSINMRHVISYMEVNQYLFIHWSYSSEPEC